MAYVSVSGKGAGLSDAGAGFGGKIFCGGTSHVEDWWLKSALRMTLPVALSTTRA